MKIIKSYNNFVNESIKDLMKPKTGEEILSNIKNISQEKKNEYLVDAAHDGDLGMVKYLIKSGADINFKNNCDLTILMIASYTGHLEIVKYLIDNGANINIKNENDQTAFSLSSLEVRNYLEEIGINESVRDLMKGKSDEEILSAVKDKVNAEYLFKALKNEVDYSSIEKIIGFMTQDMFDNTSYDIKKSCVLLSLFNNIKLENDYVTNMMIESMKITDKDIKKISNIKDEINDLILYIRNTAKQTDSFIGFSKIIIFLYDIISFNISVVGKNDLIYSMDTEIDIKDLLPVKYTYLVVDHTGLEIEEIEINNIKEFKKLIYDKLTSVKMINESVRDLMKPKSKEEIMKNLKNTEITEENFSHIIVNLLKYKEYDLIKELLDNAEERGQDFSDYYENDANYIVLISILIHPDIKTNPIIGYLSKKLGYNIKVDEDIMKISNAVKYLQKLHDEMVIKNPDFTIDELMIQSDDDNFVDYYFNVISHDSDIPDCMLGLKFNNSDLTSTYFSELSNSNDTSNYYINFNQLIYNIQTKTEYNA